MKAYEQLELQLWQTLQEAQAVPETADLDVLWSEMERAIQGREIKAQLEVGAEAIFQMAEIHELKRDRFFNEIVPMRLGKDPIIEADAFDRFVRQYMEVDFDQFVEEIGRKEHEYPECRELVSVVEVVDKQELLDLLEPESQLEPLPMLELEHDEDVGAWAAIVKGWMVLKGVDSVTISEVVSATQLSAVKVWIAGLLDLYLDRTSKENTDFYKFDGLNLSLEFVVQKEVA